MIKRIFTALILVAFLLSAFSVFSVSAEEAWDGKTASAFESGNGFKDDPYIISNASQLALLSGSVASGNPHTGEYFKLSNDIVLNTTDELTWYTTAQKWTPIGNPNTAFEGTFDGNGKTISGIYINCETDAQGLFGVVGQKGKVLSLAIADSTVSGNASIGGIAGENNGIIVDCVNNCSVRAVSDGGGIAGKNNGKIGGCANLAWVGNKGNDGGIAGRNDGMITDCYNNGAVDGGYLVAGGIAGENRGKIKNCYNVGYIISEYGKSGSIVGFNGGGSAENCYFLDRGSDLDTVGTLLTSEQMTVPSSFAGFDFDSIWTLTDNSEYQYPTLRGKTDFFPDETIPSDSSDNSKNTSSSESDESSVSATENSYIVWIIILSAMVLVLLIALVAVLFVKKRK